jgi:hypothetical protein
MDHMKLSDELRQQLLESAAWGKAGITPVLREETSKEDTDERIDERGSKKGDKPAKGKKGDKPDFTTGARRGDKSKTHEGEDYECASTEHEDAEGAEELEEAVHVCPLCVSQLEEAIDEERILEHLNVVVGLVDRLSQLDESEEDIETVIDETIQELLLQTDEDEE